MLFMVYNATGARLITALSYLSARRRWGKYLSTSPVPSESAGVEADGVGRLDVEALDRATGYGSPDEREPSVIEIAAAIL